MHITKGDTVLIYSARLGLTDIVEVCIRAGVDLEKQNRLKRTALIVAAWYRHIEAAKLLIDAGASLDTKCWSGRTPLIWAATTCRKHEVNLIKNLLDAGAKINIQDESGHTALMQAAIQGHIHSLLELINAHADLNTQDKWGSTALMHAISNCHIDIATTLINAGANVHLQNQWGSTALINAVYQG